MGGAVRGYNSQPRDGRDGRRGKRRPALLLAGSPSSAVTMGKLPALDILPTLTAGRGQTTAPFWAPPSSTACGLDYDFVVFTM